MTFLTRQEKNLVIFLVIGAICGVGYSYYRRHNPPLDLLFRDPRQEDTKTDSELDLMLLEAKTVNVNEASIREMTKLKGIGPILATRIVDYREENGPFTDVEEMVNVDGIGPKKLEAIKEYVVLE